MALNWQCTNADQEVWEATGQGYQAIVRRHTFTRDTAPALSTPWKALLIGPGGHNRLTFHHSCEEAQAWCEQLLAEQQAALS